LRIGNDIPRDGCQVFVASDGTVMESSLPDFPHRSSCKLYATRGLTLHILHDSGKTVFAIQLQQPVQVIRHHDIAQSLSTRMRGLVLQAIDNDSSGNEILEYWLPFPSDCCDVVNLAGNGISASSQQSDPMFRDVVVD
jgi:hypothetical protein